MGFLSALRNFLAHRPDVDDPKGPIGRLRDAWGLDEDAAARAESSVGPGPDADSASAYDKANWRRKLHTIFEKYPGSKGEWADLTTEARSLQLDEGWVRDSIVEEFTMMIRGLLADRRLSDEEQDRVRRVREMIGMSEAEAADVVRSVVADAERFFNGDVVIDG